MVRTVVKFEMCFNEGVSRSVQPQTEDNKSPQFVDIHFSVIKIRATFCRNFPTALNGSFSATSSFLIVINDSKIKKFQIQYNL